MNPRDNHDIGPIDEAIARVLEAERAAQAGIEAARNRSAARLGEARAAIRAIAARAERRILAAHQSAETRIARRQAEVEAEVRRLATDVAPAQVDSGRLDRALEAVAAALTTGRHP